MKLLTVTDRNGKKAIVEIESIQWVIHYENDKYPNLKACIMTKLGVSMYVEESVNKIKDDLLALNAQ